MSGQQSEQYLAAGCALRESRSHHSNNNLMQIDGPAVSVSHYHNHHGIHTHSATATTGCAVYCWGRGEDGQIGIGDTSDQYDPCLVDSLRDVNVRQIACGSGHTVVLSTEGDVYSWGRGDDGRLGHGDNGWKYIPRVIQNFTSSRWNELKIVYITCGSYHTAAITSYGELFTWGGGMYGKLGHGTETGHSAPKQVEALNGISIVHVACGSRHTVAVSTSGEVYSWGDRENGVTGHGDTDGNQYTPKLLEILSDKRVVEVSACGFHTACLTDTHELWTWGEGKFGRLGHGHERTCHTPRLVESLLGTRPKQVSCGGFHTAVVTEDGKVMTFGGGEHGQLGHGDKLNKLRPTLVQALDDISVSYITCGWSHSVALTSDGTLFSWGNGDHGKLGQGSEKKITAPRRVEALQKFKVVRVASYNEHTAALVEFRDDEGHVNSLIPVTSTFLQSLRSMINDSEYSDVTFILEDQPIFAHKSILSSRCEIFAAMFRSGMRESVEREIHLPNVSRSIFILLIEYIYTDCVKVEVEQAIDLYALADLYQLNKLRDTCRSVLKLNLTTDNVAMLLQHSSDMRCYDLKDICMDYIIVNFDVVSKGPHIKILRHELLLEILANRP